MIAPDSFQAQAHSNPQVIGSGDGQPIVAFFAEITALAVRLSQRADLPGAERLVLDIIRRAGAVTVPEIARQRGTSRQNIQILVDRLEAEGRVEFIANPAHKRSSFVRLTEQGAAWLRTRGRAEKNRLEEIGSQLPEIEIAAAASLLRKVRDVIGAPEQSSREVGRRSDSKMDLQQPILQPSKAEELRVEELPVNLL